MVMTSAELLLGGAQRALKSHIWMLQGLHLSIAGDCTAITRGHADLCEGEEDLRRIGYVELLLKHGVRDEAVSP